MRPQAAALKELLDKPELQVMPGCGDAMGARLIEEAGFRIGFISGSSIAALRLAMPDMDLLTFPAMPDPLAPSIAAAPPPLRPAPPAPPHRPPPPPPPTLRPPP